MNSQDYVNELFNLEGHVGIVTGASRGLGMGIAQVLTNAGPQSTIWISSSAATRRRSPEI